jgi:D-alanyl-D-alanine dipeptidase/CubicO group peptidase (beta-lactamase class C family)
VGHYFDPTNPTLAATVASLNQTSLVYPPNTRTKYSNAAIAVVGQVLEKQLTVSHPAQVEATILKPLGMTSSSFDLTPAVKERLATAYMRTYDGRRFEAPTFLLGTGPAGNMYASVVDLGKFMSCLFREGKYPGGQILSPAGLKQMMTRVQDKNGRPQNFGLGFMIQELEGNVQIGHGGAVYGFSTQLECLPERKLGVAAVAAVDGSNGVVTRIAEYALQLMLAKQDGKPLPDYRTTTKIPPERAKEIAGLYATENGARWARLTRDKDNVFLRNGVYDYELRAAENDGSLIVDDFVGFGVPVVPRTDGTITIGREAMKRVDESSAPPPPKDHWKGLIGEYGWDHDVLYILEDRGQLYALIEWFDYYPLTELSQDEYAFPDYGLYHGERLLFSRDQSGNATHVIAAEVKFDRREIGTKHGETFKIKPVKPISELREAALKATPPEEAGEFLPGDLVELTSIDPSIKLDIRYATENNFTGAVFYKEAKAFLQRPAAEAVARAHQKLKAKGYGILIHDAYRPWHVTKMFWDATPTDLHDFVANPANGSRHNRGCAVDLTLYDLGTGKPVEMVGGYDEFSPRSFPLYPGGTARERWNRQLLRDAMEAEGFEVYEFEWWHFDYKDWKKYRIGNSPFEAIKL